MKIQQAAVWNKTYHEFLYWSRQRSHVRSDQTTSHSRLIFPGQWSRDLKAFVNPCNCSVFFFCFFPSRAVTWEQVKACEPGCVTVFLSLLPLAQAPDANSGSQSLSLSQSLSGVVWCLGERSNGWHAGFLRRNAEISSNCGVWDLQQKFTERERWPCKESSLLCYK